MSEEQVKVENVSGRAVLVFHAWLLPGERMALSLEAAKEAAKIAGIEMVDPLQASPVTVGEHGVRLTAVGSHETDPFAGQNAEPLEAVEKKPAGKRGKRGAA